MLAGVPWIDFLLLRLLSLPHSPASFSFFSSFSFWCVYAVCVWMSAHICMSVHTHGAHVEVRRLPPFVWDRVSRWLGTLSQARLEGPWASRTHLSLLPILPCCKYSLTSACQFLEEGSECRCLYSQGRHFTDSHTTRAWILLFYENGIFMPWLWCQQTQWFGKNFGHSLKIAFNYLFKFYMRAHACCGFSVEVRGQP